MNRLAKEFIAELLGTTILMLLGLSGSACSVLSNAPTNLITGLCYGLALVIAISFAGPISGAHINPAFTLAFAAIRKCSWKRVPIYFVAQYLGSFFGASLVWSLYFESIHSFDRELLANAEHFNHTTVVAEHTPTLTSAAIFVTLPAPSISLIPAITDQVISTALLTFTVLFITDESCYRTPKLLQAVTLGTILVAFITGFSFNCGAILNPARDLSPRILLSLVGYQRLVFEPLDYNFWWAVGIVAPHVGALLGATLYHLLAKMRAEFAEVEFGPHSNEMQASMAAMDPERDIIYQKARIVINDNMKQMGQNHRY